IVFAGGGDRYPIVTRIIADLSIQVIGGPLLDVAVGEHPMPSAFAGREKIEVLHEESCIGIARDFAGSRDLSGANLIEPGVGREPKAAGVIGDHGAAFRGQASRPYEPAIELARAIAA